MKASFIEIVSKGTYIDSVKFKLDGGVLVTSLYKYNGAGYFIQVVSAPDVTEVVAVREIKRG